jgi:aryl-phospho-beta-D-glucosidase BglC (GH1 family)
VFRLVQGATWFGPESTIGVPEGLDKAPMDFYFEFLAKNHFNALRLPFNHKAVRANGFISAGSFNPLLNPELSNTHTGAPVRYIEMLQAVVDAAARHNILVVLACERLSAEDWPGSGLWYEEHGALNEEATRDSWSRLAQAMCDRWNVVAADLMNEPHKATWAQDNPVTDWDQGATRVGNYVLNQCSRWLIFIQGINVGATGDGGASKGYFWGENLWGAIKHPISLTNQAKLVYAPHIYGPSVTEHSYFRREEGFPDNMGGIWNQHFLNARHASGTPFVIGQMGGSCASAADREWHAKAAYFFATQRVGMFYVALNPTWEQGGLLKDDWRSPNVDKLEALSSLPSTDVATLLPPSPPPPPPCRWAGGTPCHFACTMVNTLAGCVDRSSMNTFKEGSDCYYCGHFNGDPVQCVSRYFQVPDVPQVELKRCAYADGVCVAENERQLCDLTQPAPLPPPPSARTSAGLAGGGGAAGGDPSMGGGQAGSGGDVTSPLAKLTDRASGAPIFAGIIIILTCGAMGVLMGTGCLGLCSRMVARRTQAPQRGKQGRRAARLPDHEFDEPGSGPPARTAGRAMGFGFSRQAQHSLGAMRLPDEEDEESLELELPARPAPPKPAAGPGKSRSLSACNYDL